MSHFMHMHHIEGTSGSPVLLLHGFLESGEVWLPWAEKTFPDRSVYIPDLPGHGRSDEFSMDSGFHEWAQFLMSKIDTMVGAGQKIHVAGHSMGGYLALEMALLFPARIGQILLFHSTPFPDTPLQIQRRKKQIEFIEKGRKSLLLKNVGLAMIAPGNRDRLSAIGEELNREARNCSASGMIKTLVAIMNRSDYQSVMKRKMQEILLITGGHDPFMPADYYETVLSHFPEISHHHFAECGHASFLEAPEDSMRVVKRFLAGHRGQTIS